MYKKVVIGAATVAVLTVTSFMTVFAGEWMENGGLKKYKLDSGEYAAAGIYEIDGRSYGFNNNAEMVKGWWQPERDWRWYYCDLNNGEMLTGWREIDGKWYYLEPDAHRGWLTWEGKKYYFDENGVMQTGWFVEPFTNYKNEKNSGYLHRADETGALITSGTLEEDGVTYMFTDTGDVYYISERTKSAGLGWQKLMYGDAQESTIAGQKSDVHQKISQAMEKRANAYNRSVVKGTGNYSKNKTSWENETRDRLEQLGASDELIDLFIQDVYAGEFLKRFSDASYSWYYENNRAYR